MFRVVVSLGLILLTLVPLHLTGTFPAPSDSPIQNFDRLSLALDAAYPYFSNPRLDHDVLTETYRDRAEEAKTNEACVVVVREMLASLADLHTGVISPWPGSGRRCFGTARVLSDGIVIDRIGQTGTQEGLERGDRLVAIDDVPIDTA